MTDPLRRDRAPLSARAWAALDDAVGRVARRTLGARRVADFDGPRGWDVVAARRGTATPCEARDGRAAVCVLDATPLAEIRAAFTLPWAAIETYERGGPVLDTRPAERAALEVALAEDRLLLYGEPVGPGFLAARAAPAVAAQDWSTPGQGLEDVPRALAALDAVEVGGPYELLLPPPRYWAFLAACAEGYPTHRHPERVLAGVHRAPALRDAGALFSTRGGDFLLLVGGDLAVGYREHDARGVHLACLETVRGLAATPEAVCVLRG